MVKDLDNLYKKYNNIEFVHPDPFEFVLKYSNKNDMEVVGLIAASFAVGNVFQILKFLGSVFDKMGESPYLYLLNSSDSKIENDFKGFYYRYYKDYHIVEFFINISRVLKSYGSIEDWVVGYLDEDDETYFPLFKKISADFNLSSALIPKSSGNSAFKRLALYFRWMVRDDGLDLGLWKKLSPKKLIIPLDIHMMSISMILGFTKSKSNSMSNALKITQEFRKLNPKDPVKWDFSLSRLGIHPDLNYNELISLF
ncbi:TIGR02757 family protein [Thiospirochaeta perfilievii]|uniref:TIGR02757 family protein n=1 Tax=Thiospirochaeta perfilievii TaxID=252967 RepID=UPI00165978B8|nr:TIGR02757 family protein [Thiospirochaeta perfilievii]